MRISGNIAVITYSVYQDYVNYFLILTIYSIAFNLAQQQTLDYYNHAPAKLSIGTAFPI